MLYLRNTRFLCQRANVPRCNYSLVQERTGIKILYGINYLCVSDRPHTQNSDSSVFGFHMPCNLQFQLYYLERYYKKQLCIAE